MPENSVKSALLLFEIDRLTLAKLGLKSDDIDRIYRILYVTSEGFF